LGSDVSSLAFFSHQRQPVIPIQRIAHVSGLAELSPSHLSLHPRVGPWLGLRAVVVFDLPAATISPTAQPGLCEGCAKPCLGALAAATRAGGGPAQSQWEHWLRVRDSCPVGRRARYSMSQIRYHYTKDRSVIFE
jgi:hypothetical protein